MEGSPRPRYSRTTGHPQDSKVPQISTFCREPAPSAPEQILRKEQPHSNSLRQRSGAQGLQGKSRIPTPTPAPLRSEHCPGAGLWGTVPALGSGAGAWRRRASAGDTGWKNSPPTSQRPSAGARHPVLFRNLAHSARGCQMQRASSGLAAPVPGPHPQHKEQ